jgi:hypothetical protein
MINKISHEGEKKRASKDVLMYHKTVKTEWAYPANRSA